MVYVQKLVASAKSLSDPIESWACVLAIEHPIRNEVAQIPASIHPISQKVTQIITARQTVQNEVAQIVAPLPPVS